MATNVASYLLGAAWIFLAGIAYAGQATGSAQTKHGDQTTYASCSPSIGEVSGYGKVVVQCIYGTSTTQDSYFIATHPNNLELTGARFTSWLEDHNEPFLSLDFKNSSEIPAINVTVDILRPGVARRFDRLKPFRLNRSHIYERINSSGVTINAKTENTLPIVSLEELVGVVQPLVPKDFCAYDAGLVLGTPPEESEARNEESTRELLSLVNSAEPKEVINSGPSAEIKQVGVLTRVQYDTVFRQHITNYMTVFVYYAKKGATATLWYPSKKALAPLKCVDDPTWSMAAK